MSVLAMAALDVVATVVLVALGRVGWVAGVWVAAGWFGVNSLMMWRMASWAGSGQLPDRRRIMGWCVVKFPVLYLAGVGLVMLPFVRIEGVFITCTFFFAGILVAQLLGIRKKP